MDLATRVTKYWREGRSIDGCDGEEDSVDTSPTESFEPLGDSPPAPRTPFVGRVADVSAVGRMLTTSRLVVLTGVGGVGKSRLAVHIARELTNSDDVNVTFVGLAAIRDPELVGPAIANALKLCAPLSIDTIEDIIGHLRDREILIILDNCEHLVDAAASAVSRILDATSHVKILATSREVLNVAGETLWTVEPLSVETANNETGDTDAFALFCDRAAAVVPGMTINADDREVIGRICTRLDGLPLAIELAAARHRVLSLKEIDQRLEDRFALLTTGNRSAPARHRTLEAAVDWSYDLCSPTEQLLWARCAVFAGVFGLSAAEAVCSDNDLTSQAIIDGIAGLERVWPSANYCTQSLIATPPERPTNSLPTSCACSASRQTKPQKSAPDRSPISTSS